MEAVGSVVVEPATATVAVGSTLTLNAAVLDPSGETVPQSRISWASADASIADVASNGVVTGRKVGTVLIAASSRGKDAFASITVQPTPVGGVRLSVSSRAMQVGQTFQIGAETVDASGNVLPNRPVTWLSSDGSVATVNANGVVTALAPGAAIITASSEGRSAVATITVSLVPVVSVVVAPATSELVVGQTTQLTAQLKDEAGSILTGRAVTWTTNSPSVATVTSQGLVTGVGAGSATITAASEGRSATSAITVTPRPVSAVIVSPEAVTIFATQTVQLSALVTDDRGMVLTGKQITFSSSNNQIATVSSQGLVTGVSAGTATITATSEGATGRATITIAPDPVATVEISPSTASVVVGQTTQLAATARNVRGQALTGRSVIWTSSSPAVASVSTTGVVSGLSPGIAVIIASVDGKQGSATVTVRSVPVVSVSVTPSTASTIVGQSVTLTATTMDGAGNTLNGRIVGWTSSNTSIATVTSSGVVTGVGSGTATITASSEGVSGSATVTVGGIPVASVTVSPSTASVLVGQTTTLTATLRDGNGNVLTGRPITWTSSASSVATVSAAGVVTGVSGGTATITATSEGKAGSATVTVTSPPAAIASIVITPSSPRVDEGKTIQLTATAYDAGNNPINGVTFTWASSNTNRATVNSTGLVTGVRDGTVTITASAGGKTGSVTLRVDD
ncbi:MAG TPA: Ig-like domain-containing protein [Gemmatimonadaceae bacterium]|nr:Ig-like domain-containing protein [Gemmatimonadaceae bacterium]